MNPFDLLITQPILNLLILFYRILNVLSIPWALGFAIILLTTAVRLALWPLTNAQLKSTQKMAALKPHLSRIKEEHGHDKARHQQEVAKLYKEHGVNPLAGCIPLLVQIPIFIGLYNVLLKAVQTNGNSFLSYVNNKLYFTALHLDKLPDNTFFGLNLATKPKEWNQVGIYLLLVPLLTGLFQFAQSKMMAPQQANETEQDKKKDDKENKQSMEDTMSQMQSQMVFIMPAMIAFFSYSFPIGLALYWNTFTIIGIVQQYFVAGAGALNKYLPKSWRK